MNRRLLTPPEPAPPSVHEIVEALESARQLLSDCHNLAKGSALADIDGWPCLCTVAATITASRTTAIRDEVMKAARHALGPRYRSIEAWNDLPRTTVEDAKTLLQRAKSYVGSVAA